MGPKTVNRLAVLTRGKKANSNNINSNNLETATATANGTAVTASSIATGTVTSTTTTTTTTTTTPTVAATSATSIINGISHAEGSHSSDNDLGEMHGMMSSAGGTLSANSSSSSTPTTSRHACTDDDLLETLERLRAVDDDDDDDDDDMDELPLRAVDDDDNDDDHVGHHPALRTMCVVDCDNNTRIIPNGPPAILDNECFVGKVMLLIRTPDVDDLENADHAATATAATANMKLPSFKLNTLSNPGQEASLPFSSGIPPLAETPARISQYFKHKKRRFEFQFQVKLKRIPTGPLFLGCELEHAIRVGTITKGLVGILLAMVRRINPGFHYSWGTLPHSDSHYHHHHGASDAAQIASGNYEKTHLSFPVEASMDRIVITKPGQALPELGFELEESVESVKRRRKMGSGSVDWNLHDTYTMCLWSAYCDWIQWKSLNVPGMSPFSLSRVTGLQPIYLSVYEISNITPAEYRKKRGATPHTRQHLRVYTRLEFSNDERTVGGIAEQLLGKSTQAKLLGSSHGVGGIIGGDAASLPDTESVHSDFETKSRVTVL